GKSEAEKRLATMHKQVTNEETFTMQLKSLGMTEDQLRKRLTDAATAETVLMSKVSVSDADIKKFYDDNPTKFQQPEKVKAAHVLISTGNPHSTTPMSDSEKQAKLKIAQNVLKRAKANEDFAKLAKEFSDDPGSKDNGGEYTFARGEMVPEFEAAAFSLQTNQISDIVTTQYGYHIIKLLEKFPAKKLELAEVKPDIKAYLEQSAVQKMLPDYYATLKKDAKVEILDNDLKALEEAQVDLPPASIPPTSTK
ncbi:MAG TPA: peptidylprolyl isomerase, partial [Verrucomicrobiae bacterium]|nr:peptidylprolyl isomerase [Verrucomicrobiae bacterium]